MRIHKMVMYREGEAPDWVLDMDMYPLQNFMHFAIPLYINHAKCTWHDPCYPLWIINVMSPSDNSIIELSKQGMSSEDIALATGCALSYVKTLLVQSSDITEEELNEVKHIILDVARGRMVGGTVDNALNAAIYIHKSAVEDRRLTGNGSKVNELMDLLKEKAARKMKEILV